MTRYDELLQALKDTGIPFAETAWANSEKLKDDYGVLAIDGKHNLFGDGIPAETCLEGTVDLYCHQDPAHSQSPEKVEHVLYSFVDMAVGDPTVMYEPDTRLTHWEWVIQLLR